MRDAENQERRKRKTFDCFHSAIPHMCSKLRKEVPWLCQ